MAIYVVMGPITSLGIAPQGVTPEGVMPQGKKLGKKSKVS